MGAIFYAHSTHSVMRFFLQKTLFVNKKKKNVIKCYTAQASVLSTAVGFSVFKVKCFASTFFEKGQRDFLHNH